ncbi:MAG TPA: GIY-YIG nuclease family protein [Vicinamibacterales bacterium]|nr:GIY-YIG nuclease family protein [Vicinamibacterales bacterium]
MTLNAFERVEGQQLHVVISRRRWHRRRVAHYAYLLRCADNSLYVGETSDLPTRERDHNEGRGGSYTAKRRPVQIVYAEQHRSREDALTRERQIKRWSTNKKEMLVRGDLAGLSGTSQRARIPTAFTWEDWLTRYRE